MNSVVQTVLNAEDLPTPPGVALQLLELFGQPDVEVDEMAKLIGADPSLTAKLINYCNSPLLGRTSKTTNIRHAIVTVGMRAAKILTLSFSLVRRPPISKNSFDYDEFWNRSLATAVVAKTLGALCGDGDDEFLTGLMLDIGQVGLVSAFPAKYAEIIKQSKETGVPISQLEREEWSLSHIDISVELIRNWNFPPTIVQRIETFAKLDEVNDATPKPILNLKLAQQIVSLFFHPELREDDVSQARNNAEKWFGIRADRFCELFDRASKSWSELAQLLDYDTSKSQTLEQLEGRARKGIAQLSMGLFEENEAIHQQNAKLKINAMIDSLTGLKNRRAYDDEALAEWNRAARMKRTFVLMMVDIDRFKRVNDTHGHAIGDIALVAVAEQLRKNAREYDSVYRFGGEEFVIMLPECDLEAAMIAANRFREAIEQLAIPLDEGVLHITVSIGVAIHMHPEAGTLKSLLEAADKLLYQAKQQGRNRVCSGRDGLDHYRNEILR